MCIICVEMAQGRLRSKEARRNLGEMSEMLDDEHKKEVKKKISELEVEEQDD